MKQNQKLCTKMKKVIDRGKRSKILSEVKPVEKSAEFSRDKSHAKGSPCFTSHELQGHAYEC